MITSKVPGEPIVAHGSRMSWAGILRPDDVFPAAKMSRLAVLTSESGPPLRRYFGSWSVRYRRFTTNLSSVKIRVDTSLRREPPVKGVECVVHWVDARDMIRSDSGGVCAGDGWPVDLWNGFTSVIDQLPPGTISEKLRSFQDSRLLEQNPVVAHWRATLREEVVSGSTEFSAGRSGLIPVPATLVTEVGTTACIVSWDPNGLGFPSLSDALDSPGALINPPDLVSQARYYLESTLAKLHGIRFGPNDAVEDSRFARTPEVMGLQDSFRELEQQRISNPRFGLLDRFG
jgi:hypothetical protein